MTPKAGGYHCPWPRAKQHTTESDKLIHASECDTGKPPPQCDQLRLPTPSMLALRGSTETLPTSVLSPLLGTPTEPKLRKKQGYRANEKRRNVLVI